MKKTDIVNWDKDRGNSSSAIPIVTDLDLLMIMTPPWLPNYPPLGPLCVVNYLNAHGCRAAMYDLNVELFRRFPESSESWLLERIVDWQNQSDLQRLLATFHKLLNERAKRIVEANPFLIGLSHTGGKQFFIAAFIELLLKNGYTNGFIIGGSGCSTYEDRKFFAAYADEIRGFVIKEGEQPALSLVTALKSGCNDREIEGIIYSRTDRPGIDRTRTFLPLDLLPIFDPNLIVADQYTTKGLMIEWSRGCVNRCRFCEMDSLWGRIRTKSALKRVEEIVSLHDRHGYSEFSLADPAVNGHRKVLNEFCRKLIPLGLGRKIRWAGHAIPSRAFQLEDYDLMAKAGCYRLEFGIESASEQVLRLMNKWNPIEIIERNLHDAKEVGIEVVIYLLIGYPGETEADLDLTLAFLERNRNSIDEIRSANALILQTNSYLFEHMNEVGLSWDNREAVRSGAPISQYGHLWAYGNDNTLEIRQQRLRRLIERIDELAIPYYLSTGLDEFKELVR